MGFGPGTISSPIDAHEDERPVFGVLRLTPYRVTFLATRTP